MPPIRVVPINEAEAILDPLWDPQQSGFSDWHVEPGDGHGLRVWQNWCWVGFEWASRPPIGPALRMSRHYGVSCSGYDHLMVSAMAPIGAVLRITASTDRGQITMEAAPAGVLKQEHHLDLDGAARLDALHLEVHAADSGTATGWFNWVGFQNTDQIPAYVDRWRRMGHGWDVFLQPETYEPRFEPSHGLVFSAADLSKMRDRHDATLAAAGSTRFTEAAFEAGKREPESMVRDFVNFWGDTRYCRERDHGNELLRHGASAALAGLLLRDAGLLRLAARYALAIGLSGHWDDGAICRLPGAAWEHRCFVQSLCTHELALILDLSGEMFTDGGRDFLVRRIAEEGLASIDYATWRHPYIFECNQLAWFTPGRMLGCALMERLFPRARRHTEIAHDDLVESMADAILADGGYVEGPTYFRMMSEFAGFALLVYARARDLTLPDVIPDALRRTGDFAAALASTSDDQDMIPICDASPMTGCDMPAVMAATLPGSAWTLLYHRAVERAGGMPGSLLALLLEEAIPQEDPVPPPFTCLPEMGLASSTRLAGDAQVKILILGNHAGAGHTHEDKGSFVLEFAGETYAMDPGTCDYASPLAEMLQYCERHNMLVPTGLAQRPHPQCPLLADVRPQARGDETAFHAAIDATPGWEGVYARWQRTWVSPAPLQITITDEWELDAGSGVAFLWQTRLPVDVCGGEVVIRGVRGRAIIGVPDGAAVSVEELPLLDGIQRRIALRMDGMKGSMTVAVRLEHETAHP